jgi:transcription elongation factor Elf1
LGTKSTSTKDINIKDSISNGLKPYVEKLSFAEKLSMYLISKYGEPKDTFYVTSAGTGSVFLIIAAWLQSGIFFLIGISFLLFSTLFYDTKNYYVSRVCKKCGKEFAYKETREPLIINNYSKIVTITSYYKCKYCGREHEETRNVVSTSDIDVNYYPN